MFNEMKKAGVFQSVSPDEKIAGESAAPPQEDQKKGKKN